jgi:L,D-transpeptidase catalytic domain
MHYWMRITSYGVGLHAGEIPPPGEAASHGCIRLPKKFVPRLSEATKVGTPVKIIRGNWPQRNRNSLTSPRPVRSGRLGLESAPDPSPGSAPNRR